MDVDELVHDKYERMIKKVRKLRAFSCYLPYFFFTQKLYETFFLVAKYYINKASTSSQFTVIWLF